MGALPFGGSLDFYLWFSWIICHYWFPLFLFVVVFDHLFKRPRNHLENLAPIVFCCLSWAVMDQNVILSPQSQVMEVDPRFSPFAADSIIGLFDIVFLQFGHVIAFAIVSSQLAQVARLM
jgi:hypothetical protein